MEKMKKDAILTKEELHKRYHGGFAKPKPSGLVNFLKDLEKQKEKEKIWMKTHISGR